MSNWGRLFLKSQCVVTFNQSAASKLYIYIEHCPTFTASRFGKLHFPARFPTKLILRSSNGKKYRPKANSQGSIIVLRIHLESKTKVRQRRVSKHNSSMTAKPCQILWVATHSLYVCAILPRNFEFRDLFTSPLLTIFMAFFLEF